MHVCVQIINRSALISDADLSLLVSAVQTQVTNHFSPLWGIDAALSLCGVGQMPDLRQWWVVVADHPEQMDEHGYADLTPRGMPLGRVYVQVTKQYGSSLSVALSQEVLSTLADPHLLELRMNASQTIAYALEVCAPVEPERYGYRIGEDLVSDFICKNWYNDSAPGPYDFAGHLTRPFQILPGGYSTQLDTTQAPRAWVEQTSTGHDATSHKQAGSRLDRRARFRANGRRSLSRMN